MNKFSDGFSDNSYDDLLNEYAGDALGSRRQPKVEPQKRISKPATPPKKTEPAKKPSFVTDSPKVKRPTVSEKANNFEPIKPFDERDIHSSSKNSNTMEFAKQPRRTASQNNRVARPAAKKAKPSFNAVFKNVSKQIKNNANKAAVKENLKKPVILLKNQKGDRKKLLIVSLCCVFVAVICSLMILSCVNDVLAINRSNETIVEVTLPNDANTFKALRALDKAGLIKNTMFCNLFVKMMGYTDENYLPGIYYFTPDMGVEKMLTRFKTSVQRGKIISVTIPEGYTIDQIFNRLEKNDICSASALYKVIEDIDFSDEYDFIAQISNKEERYHALEGYFFPATYEFEQGATPGAVIREFLNTFQKRWTEDYAKQAQALGKTTDEIMILASIIEKEGANKDQFKLVSSVLHNRLNRSGLYPTLECNSTKDYVTNTIAKRVTATSKINSFIFGYSTYERAGLPVSAICNPGVAAIEAALYPESTQYYYFRHDKNGKIYMALNLDEHSANGRIVEKVNAEEN